MELDDTAVAVDEVADARGRRGRHGRLDHRPLLELDDSAVAVDETSDARGRRRRLLWTDREPLRVEVLPRATSSSRSATHERLRLRLLLVGLGEHLTPHVLVGKELRELAVLLRCAQKHGDISGSRLWRCSRVWRGEHHVHGRSSWWRCRSASSLLLQ